MSSLGRLREIGIRQVGRYVLPSRLYVMKRADPPRQEESSLWFKKDVRPSFTAPTGKRRGQCASTKARSRSFRICSTSNNPVARNAGNAWTISRSAMARASADAAGSANVFALARNAPIEPLRMTHSVDLVLVHIVRKNLFSTHDISPCSNCRDYKVYSKGAKEGRPRYAMPAWPRRA
jgi:hypothetical protein